MALTVQSTLRRPASNLYFDNAFRKSLEQHLPYLRRLPAASWFDVSPDDIYRFEGDLYGYLLKKLIDPSYHWITMRLNHMTHPNEFGQRLHDVYEEHHHLRLQQPPIDALEQIKKHYLTRSA